MALPTETLTVIKNGRIVGDLDMQNNQLVNLDASNIPGVGGAADPGTSTAILKCDGNHGFNDAVADTDYATPAAINSKEPLLPTTTNDRYLLRRRSVANSSTWEFVDPASIGSTGNDTGITTAILKGDGAHGFDDAVAGTDYATPAAVDATQDALDAYITANDTAVAAKADASATTTALAAKADATATTTALATKEPTLPTTANNAYVLARHNAGAGGGWYFVDPVTLGSTSGTYSDGASINASTQYDSPTQAVFTTNDTGKTITGANIPASTTITYVSPTRVTLSNAATATGSGLTFTILNRFLAAGGGGTVTGVAVDTATNVSDLLTNTVSNPTTSVGITFSKPQAPAKTFYGNNSASAAGPNFMNQAGALQALDATTVGKNILQLPNPGSVPVYLRVVGPSSAVDVRNPTEMRGDIGAEKALTINSPLTRTGPAADQIGIPPAASSPSQVNGYLTGADHATFTAKLASDRKITTTAPITINSLSGTPVDLSADRTIAMPAAASSPSQVNGYLSGADHADFKSRVPASRSLTTTAPLRISDDTLPTPVQRSGVAISLGANRLIDIPKATAAVDGYLDHNDFATFAGGSANTVTPPLVGGVPQTSGNWTIATTSPPVTRVVLPLTLTGAMTITLPSAANYAGSYPSLEIVDVATPPAMTNFGVTLKAPAGQSIDGGAVAGTIDLPHGSSYIRLNGDGGTKWFTTKYFVDAFKDPGTPTKIARVDVSGLQPGASRTLKIADAATSVTVIPTDSNAPGVVFDISDTGGAVKRQLNPTDLLPKEAVIGLAGFDIAFNTVTPSSVGDIDTIRIAGNLIAPLTIIWPPSAAYNFAETLTLIDASGTVDGTNFVTITNTVDSFNQDTSFIFDEAFGRKVLTSQYTAHAWSVSLTKSKVQPFTVIAPSASVFQVVVDPNAIKQNAHLNLLNGQNTLQIIGPYDGMPIELVLAQPASGAAGTLFLPSVSYVAGGGLGAVTLTLTNGAIDRLRGSFDGSLNAYLWDAPVLNHTSAVLPTAASGLAASGITSSKVDLSWTDNANNETGYQILRNVGGAAYTEIGVRGPVAGSGGSGTYTDNSVTQNVPNYHYKVKPFNAGGYGNDSNIITVSTPSGGPSADLWEIHFNDGTSAPTNTFTAAATVGPAATLEYSDWTTATKNGVGAAFNPIAGMVTTSASGAVVGTGGAVTYNYRVAAWKGGRHNANNLIVVASANLHLDGTNLNRITWSAVTGADYYEIYRNSVPAGAIGNAGQALTVGRLITPTTPFTGTSFDDTGGNTNGTIPAGVATATDVHSATADAPITWNSALLSVSFWVKSAFVNTSAGRYNIVTAGNTAFQIGLISNNKFQITFPGIAGTCTGTVPTTAINDNTTWHHVAVLFDASAPTHTVNDIKVYLDNVAQTVTYTTTTNTGPYTFPASIPQVGSVSWAGAIDDVRIYTGALTLAQISALATGNPS